MYVGFDLLNCLMFNFKLLLIFGVMNWLYSFKEKIELIVNCICVIMKKNYVYLLVVYFLIFNIIYIYVYFVGIYLYVVY